MRKTNRFVFYEQIELVEDNGYFIFMIDVVAYANGRISNRDGTEKENTREFGGQKKSAYTTYFAGAISLLVSSDWRQLDYYIDFKSFRGEDKIKMWLRLAFQRYYSQISIFRDQVEQMKPKKPEIYVRLLLEEVFGAFDDFYVEKIMTKFSFGLEDFYKKVNKVGDKLLDIPFSLDMLTKTQRVDYCAKIVFDQVSYRLSKLCKAGYIAQVLFKFIL